MSLIAYKSSAGSGKTSTLVMEYLALALKNPKNFRQIIALTFTLKATSEMKERLIEYLVFLKNIDPNVTDNKDQYIIDNLKTKTGFNTNELKQQSGILLENILHNYGDFGFSTIDSFVVKIVRSFAHDLQLSSNFDIELDKNVLINNAIEQLYERIGKDEKLTQFLVDFTISQLDDEKSTNLDKPLSQLAGLIFDSKHYKNIDQLKKVPLEDFVRIKTILQENLKEYDSKMKTFGQQGFDCMEKSGINKGDTSRAWLYSYFERLNNNHKYTYNIQELESKTFIGYIEENKQWYAKKNEKTVGSIIDAAKPQLLDIINKVRNYYKKQLPFYIADSMVLKKITPLALIHQLKRFIEQQAIDNDIIHLSEVNRKISEVVSEQHAPFIYERIGQRYNHYLVDEFQDTSVIQWNNILPLIDNSLASGYKNLLVGDAKQSIYRWRDGEVEQFVNLPKLDGADKSKLIAERQNLLEQVYTEIPLDKNYRSLESIVYFNNTLFKSLLTDEPDYVNKFFQNHHQTTNKKTFEGIVGLKYYDDKLDLLLQGIYEQILELKSQNYNLGDICILARKNKHLTEIADFLIQNNINIVSADALYLYKSKPVNLIISFMQIINQKEISTNIHSILRYLLDDKILKGIGNIEDPKVFFNLLNDYGFEFEEAKMHKMEAYELSEYIIHNSKIKNPINPFLFSLLDLILEQTKKSGASVSHFLEFWEDKHSTLKIDIAGDENSVQLLSIHKAKGLEFPIVIFPVIGFDSSLKDRDYLWAKANDDISPIIPKVLIGDENRGLRSSFNKTLKEEENRKKLDELNMIYVACTRPTEQLFLFFTEETKSKAFWEKRIKPILWEEERILLKDDDHIILGNTPILSIIKPKEDSIYNIDKYIQSEWRTRIQLKRESHISKINIENLNKGIQLHNILSNLNTNSNIDQLLNEADKLSQLNIDYRDEFEAIMNSLISNSESKIYFNSEQTHLSEKEILTPDNEIYRPDKVIQTSSNIIVVDYKYANYTSISESEKNKHLEQIDKYSQLISNIERIETIGILIYLQGETKIINANGYTYPIL